MNNTEAIKALESMWNDYVDNIAVDATVRTDWADAMKKACEALRRKDERNMSVSLLRRKDVKSMSVSQRISALALINIADIFEFIIGAKDGEINDRYGSEERAVDVAEKCANIAFRAQMLQNDIKGWSMTYTMPIKGGDERREYKARFYDARGEDA